MISVIVPVYRVEQYLRQCVDSILNQTYEDLEVLLIDDGSPDRCGEICDEYAEKDDRVHVFHTENRGLSAARNLGLREAKGEYIGFVDSDDWIEPDMYEVLLRRLQESGADISVCGISDEYVNNKTTTYCSDKIYDSIEAVKALICGDLGNQMMNKLWTRKAAAQLQFPEGHAYEDIFVVYKVLGNIETVAAVNKTLYRYRQRRGSITRSFSMTNLIDYWNANHERCNFLRSEYENRKDTVFEYELEKQCAYAIARTWRWFYGVPRKERNYVYLSELNSYASKNYGLFGDRRWPLYLRMSIFLAHYANGISLGLSYAVNRMLCNKISLHALWP